MNTSKVKYIVQAKIDLHFLHCKNNRVSAGVSGVLLKQPAQWIDILMIRATAYFTHLLLPSMQVFGTSYQFLHLVKPAIDYFEVKSLCSLLA